MMRPRLNIRKMYIQVITEHHERSDLDAHKRRVKQLSCYLGIGIEK
jgi:hypothetical protein